MPTAERTASDRPTEIAFDAVYERLKALASRQLAHGTRGTLDKTALVHEVFLRLEGARELSFGHSAQFFAYAARATRHVLVDRARARLRNKAGGDWLRITLTATGAMQLAIASAEQTLALDEALTNSSRPTRAPPALWSCAISPGSRASRRPTP